MDDTLYTLLNISIANGVATKELVKQNKKLKRNVIFLSAFALLTTYELYVLSRRIDEIEDEM